MSKSAIHPEDSIVISKKWLEGEIKYLEDKVYLSDEQRLKGHALVDIFRLIISSSTPLKPVLEEKEAILNAVYQGAENWKQEYDECRKILIELCALKKEKDSLGKTDHYLENQPEAWKKAFEFITKYQHHVE